MNRIFYKFQILTAALFFLTVQLSHGQVNNIVKGELTSTDQTTSVERDSEALSLPFYEGFEADVTIPAGWTQEVVNGPLWIVDHGNEPYPAQPYAGNHNLVFRSHIPYATGLITRLVMPPLDLTGTETAVLKFHYANAGIYNFFLYLDRLTIKYKASADDEWTTIESFHEDLTEWTEVSLVLPNPSDSYYIAFEGESGAGIGISIDEVTIGEEQITGLAGNLSERVQLYPNPAHDYLNIELPDEAFLQLFDLQGKLQYEANLPAGNRRINFSGFDQAMYIVKLQFEDQLLTKRILHF